LKYTSCHEVPFLFERFSTNPHPASTASFRCCPDIIAALGQEFRAKQLDGVDDPGDITGMPGSHDELQQIGLWRNDPKF
jgi:hypothetical protein